MYHIICSNMLLFGDYFNNQLHFPWDASPSHSTSLHTPGWPRWLCQAAARPVRWCVLWYPSPGWKTLARGLERWSKRDGKKKKNHLVHWFLPVLRVVFSLGDTESLLCCSPKSPTLFSCWESQTVCQATRQSLPFVSELGYHSKLWGVTELYGHTAQLPKQECMAIRYFWTNGWHQ